MKARMGNVVVNIQDSSFGIPADPFNPTEILCIKPDCDRVFVESISAFIDQIFVLTA